MFPGTQRLEQGGRPETAVQVAILGPGVGPLRPQGILPRGRMGSGSGEFGQVFGSWQCHSGCLGSVEGGGTEGSGVRAFADREVSSQLERGQADEDPGRVVGSKRADCELVGSGGEETECAGLPGFVLSAQEDHG